MTAFEVPWPGYVCFSPDGSKFVVAGWCGHHFSTPRDAPLHLCDLKTGKITDLEGQASYFGSAQFSGDGNRVFANAGGKFVLWDAATAKRVAELAVNGHSYSACALNHGGDLLAAQPFLLRQKFEWHFFDAKTGKRRNDLTGPQVGESVSFAPDGKAVLVGDQTGVLWWDPAAGKPIRRFEGDPSWMPVRFTPDGKTLVATSRHALLRWDAATGERLRTAHIHDRTCDNSDLSPDGAFIALDSHPAVISLAALTVAHIRDAKLRSARGLSFSDDGKWLTAIARTDTPGGVVSHRAVVFSTRTWGEVCTVPVPESGQAAFSPDGKTLAVAANEKVEFFDTATAKPFGEYKLPAGAWPSGAAVHARRHETRERPRGHDRPRLARPGAVREVTRRRPR